MKVQYSHSLTNLNTFRINSTANYFCELKSEDELEPIVSFLKNSESKFFVLGGGSNVLLPDFFDGLVVLNKLQGIDKINEDENFAYMKAMAGEPWDDFVKHCIERSWFGLENLSLIPGTVGASPIQNISAYGVEVKDFIDAVEVFDIEKKHKITIENKDCLFKYRDSIFKSNRNLIVISVLFRLKKKPELNISYLDIKEKAKDLNVFTAMDLRNCVIDIRRNKLPEPVEIPNAGSFFHNPIVNISESLKLKVRYPTLPVYELSETQVKLSAGWLIENAGLKGFREGNVGVYSKHALVLVNHNTTTQKEVLEFASLIQKKVFNKFGVSLHIEPIVIC